MKTIAYEDIRPMHMLRSRLDCKSMEAESVRSTEMC